MKIFTSLLPGLVSSALISVGFSRWASLVDPIARNIRISNSSPAKTVSNCATPCFVPEAVSGLF